MKYIVYRDHPHIEGKNGVMSTSNYSVYTLHENETYEVRERAPKHPGVTRWFDHCFVVINNDGIEMDKRIGDVVSEHDNKRQAQVEASRLNCIVEIMEA